MNDNDVLALVGRVKREREREKQSIMIRQLVVKRNERIQPGPGDHL
jgi:hypothetical protein